MIKSEEVIMKKIFVILGAALFALVACTKEASVSETVAKELVFNISLNHPEDTKAVKTGWVKGDIVYVFFEGITATTYVKLVYNGVNWAAKLNGGLSETAFITGLSSEGNMYAVFFPYAQPVIESDGGTGVTFKTGGANPAKAGLGIYTYYMTSTPTATYTKDTSGDIATISGTLNMEVPDNYVHFYIGATGGKYNTNDKYRLSVEGVKPKACVSFNAGVFGTKELNDAQPMWGYKYGTGSGVAFSGVIDETWGESSNSHLIYLFDTEAAAKAITISDKTLSSHDAVNFTSKYHPTNAKTLWAAAATAPGTVTAGGIKWGTFNLGATAAGTAAENYGWYFMWGDIIPQRGGSDAPSGYASQAYYNATVAKEALHGKNKNLTGDYAIYDMAKAFLGPAWRMPTGGVATDAENNNELWNLTRTGANPVVPMGENPSFWDNHALIVQGITFPAAGRWYNGNYEFNNVSAYYLGSTYYEEKTGQYASYMYMRDIDGAGPNHGQDPCYSVSVRPVQDAE